MKHITISLDDELYNAIELLAAKAGLSIQLYVVDVLRRRAALGIEPVMDRRREQIDALERILAGPKWDVMRDGRMPTADERNER